MKSHEIVAIEESILKFMQNKPSSAASITTPPSSKQVNSLISLGRSYPLRLEQVIIGLPATLTPTRRAGPDRR